MTAAPPLERPAARYRAALATTRGRRGGRQRLRHEVFALECGAALDPAGAAWGLDVDEWDELCDHLVVHEETSGRVVGTCRLLPPERAAALGRSYGDGEFDLTRLAGLRPGWSRPGAAACTPATGAGAVITQLWAGVAGTSRRRPTGLGGRMSIPLADGGATAAGLWGLLVRERRLAPAGLWVLPHVPYDVDAAALPGRLVMPPLMRASLRIGAHVCGPPAHDAGWAPRTSTCCCACPTSPRGCACRAAPDRRASEPQDAGLPRPQQLGVRRRAGCPAPARRRPPRAAARPAPTSSG